MTVVNRTARIRIELKDIDPTIWRSVEVPLTTSLKSLHDVIQAVMPFENYHHGEGPALKLVGPKQNGGARLITGRRGRNVRIAG
jgi:hypothetical protein